MMGYRGAWIAFADIDKAEVLSRLSLRDTGAPDDTGMEPFVSGMTAAEVNEGVMTSWARSFEDGKEQWEIMHIGDEGIFDLYADGTLPPEFAAIKQKGFDVQTANGGEDAGVDFVYEVPADTAAAITGYRPDGDNLGEDDPLPVMTILEPV